MMRYMLFCSGLLWMSSVQAFPCFVTLMKDRCWANYEVTVGIWDTVHDKLLTSVVVPKGKAWARAQFVCEAKEELRFVAQFSPSIWQNDSGHEYSSSHNWFLPMSIEHHATAWNVPVCYPKDFADVPMPPGDLSNCGCSEEGIPAIPPQ